MRKTVFIQKPTNWLGVTIKLVALLVLVGVTNSGFFERITLLYQSARWFTLIFYLAIWGVSIGALMIAAFQPNKKVRMVWALILSVSASVAYMYSSISGSDLSVFDALSLWTAKHEAGRAVAFYGFGVFMSLVVFVASFVAIASPPVPNGRWTSLGLKWLSWSPVVPVFLMSAIIVLKDGGGSQAMPTQFHPLAVGLVTAKKIHSQNVPVRQSVKMMTVQPRAIKNIVMLIDESVRGDYLNWADGNPYTPALAANKAKIVNFGMAASGANCSSYSNAILRFGPNRNNLVKTAMTNPVIWQYAKKAGYRTVYIDGQSGLNKDPGLLQNFMTVSETAYIDRVVRFTGVSSPQLDFELLKVIEKELQSDQPVFIYANKNGAHFPYDQGYPKSNTKFRPTVQEAGEDNTQTRVNSYLNVLNWSVDKFFDKFFTSLNLDETAVIYTSDHGQAVYNGKLTHCSTSNVDPREGLVPLLTITNNKRLKARFAKGAKLNVGRASHFQIRSTVLDMMGFPKSEVLQKYGPSMFVQGPANTKFLAGDIFGVFRSEPYWTSLDLTKNYKEFSNPPLPTPGQMVTTDR